MTFTKDSPSIRSLRSLTSLQMVPPPQNDQDIAEDIENWDPFPAPYAPHAMNGLRVETRDETECQPSTSDEYCERDDAAAELMQEDEFSSSNSNKRKKPLSKLKIPVTPPRLPQPRRSEAAAAYEQRGKYFRRSGSSSGRSRSRTPDRKKGYEPLIKVTANGSVDGDEIMEKSRRPSLPRSTDPTILTKGHIKQHQRVLSQIESPNHSLVNKSPIRSKKKRSASVGSTPTKPDKSESERNVSSSIQPSSDRFNRKVFMIGTSKVYSRTLIPPTVYHNTVSDLWIVIINTNAKLTNNNIMSNNTDYKSQINCSNNNSVKAFSFRTEKEARASAYANAPPVMIPFDECKECMLCETKFTMFKRPRHCRNCGICICSNYACCTVWKKSMIPETFNIKKEGAIKVCTSCHTITKRFQHALMEGRYGTAVELYLTGNINLRVPFAFKGGNKESMFPVHCAIEGRSEKLLRWLVDVQHCPIHVMSTGNTKSSSVTSNVIGAGADMIKSFGSSTEKKHDFVPTLKTGKGRSVMDLAMKAQHVGILCYLINKKNVSVYEVEDLELALGSMEALAKAFPANGSHEADEKKECAVKAFGKSGSNSSNVEGQKSREKEENKRNSTERVVGKSKANRGSRAGDHSPIKARVHSHTIVAPPKEKLLLPRDVHRIHEGTGLYGAIGGYDDSSDDSNFGNGEEEHDTIILEDDNSVSTTVPDTCILCEEKDVDCVATPCGHQMCCLTCSLQCLRCPICNLECHFIEIYQP